MKSSNSLLKEDSEFEKYIELFDGNMKSIMDFVSSGYSLEGIFIYFLMLILNLAWINFQKIQIREKLLPLSQTLNKKNLPNLLKSMIESKKNDGWTNLFTTEALIEIWSIRQELEKEDLIVLRGKVQAKLKNGLTEQVINDY